ncbi:MAG TPA: GAF domain-containing protein, partial [Rubrivivax sp.]|nr:GAF domain-containing protein [Rubrivivax sp.]
MADARPVFERILDSCERLFGTRDLGVFLIDEQQRLCADACRGNFAEWAPKNYPRPAAGTLSQMAIDQGSTLYWEDTLASAWVPEYMKGIAREYGNFTGAVAPLMWQGRGIGTLNLMRTPPRPMTDKELALQKTFADQAVIAIQNARLFNETKEALEHQTATAEVLRVIGNSMADPKPVFEKIVECCERLFDARAFGVGIVGDEGQLSMPVIRMTASARAEIGDEQADAILARTLEAFPRPLAGTLTERALRQGKLVEVSDLLDDPDSAQPAARAAREFGLGTSVVVAPLLWQGRGIGSLTMFRRDSRGLQQKENALLRAFADQAVIAIQNARLFNETKEALERQTATADILKVIAASPSDVQPVLDAIVASAKRLVDGYSATVWLRGGDRLRLTAFTQAGEVADGVLRRFGEDLVVNDQYALAPLRTGQPIQIANVMTDPRVTEQHRELGQARGFHALANVPLMREGVAIGMISVTRVEAGEFTTHQIELLQTFADQAVIAIENVRLFNETQEALERQTATADILKVIAASPSDVQPVFEAIAASSKRLLNAFSTTVFRIIDGVLHLEAYTPTNQEADATLTAMFPRSITEFPPIALIQDGRIASIEDTETDASVPPMLRDLARLRGYRSMLYMPLMRDGQVAGLIAVTRQPPGPWAEHHQQLLRTFADQAVIAVEN